MNKKLVLAAVIVLVACAGLWWTLRGTGGGRGARPARGDVAESSPAAAPAPSELAAAAEPERPAPRAERTDAAPRPAELAREHQTFADEGALWLDVTVLLPSGVPAGDEPALLGFARKAKGDHNDWETNQLGEKIGLDDAFASDVEEEYDWSRRALARSVRLPFPAGSERGLVFVQSRYLHLDPVTVELPGTTALTIEPELGAYVTGVCTFAGEPVEGSEIELEFQGRARDQGMMGFARPDGRKARVRDDLTFEVRALSAEKDYAVAGKAKGFVGHFELSFQVRAGEHHEVTIAFRPGATVAGFVRGDGQALEGAGVSAKVRGGRPWQDDLSVETGADGSFVLAGIPPGKVKLSANKDGWRNAEGETLEVVEGQRVEGVELVLDAGRRISGRVLWPDGTPAKGADVLASKLNQRWMQTVVDVEAQEDGTFVLGGLEDEVVEVFARAKPGGGDDGGNAADAEGELEDLDDVPGLARMVRARVPGSWVARAVDVAPDTSDLVLTLQQPHEVRGVVVDDTGAPVKSFEVSASMPERPSNAPEETQGHFQAEDGAFTLSVGLPGAWSFRAREDERSGEGVEIPIPQGGAELRLVLPRASTVAGVVVDPAGRPISGAKVHLNENEEEAQFSRFGGSNETTGPEGRFEIEAPRGGHLSATHDQWAASESVALQLVPGEELVDVVLQLRVGARITGEVFDAEGKPQAGQNVNCSGSAMAAMAFGFGGESSATSDGSGRFVFEHVTPGKITVSALPSTQEMMEKFQDGADETAFLSMLSDMRTATIEVADGGEGHVVLGAKPKKPVRVHGVVTEAGRPVAEQQVMAFAEGGALLVGMKFAPTDAAGRYELLLDRPGDYVFGVGKGLDGGTGTQFYVAVPEVEELEQDLALPLGRISGSVVGPDGPAGGVPLRLVAGEGIMGLEDLSESSRQTTTPRGDFAFEHLKPGSYSLHVGSAGFDGGGEGDSRFGQVVVDGIRVEKDRAVEGLVVRIGAPGTLAGIVRDAAGNPESGVTVFVRDAAGRAISASSCRTDVAGRFTYEGIAPGRVTASARSSRLVSADSDEVEVRAGETSEVELVVGEGTFLRISLLEDDQPVRARLRVLDESGRRVDDLMSMEDIMGILGEGFSSRERRVGPLPPGKYSLIATTEDGKDAKTAVRVEAGQDERNVKMRLK